MNKTIQETLTKGVELHIAGRFDLASQLYSAVIKLQADHADANHNMGLLMLDIGHDTDALPYLQTALQADMSVAQFWLSYTKALIKLERMDEAAKILDLAKESGFEGNAFHELNIQLQEFSLQNKNTKGLKTSDFYIGKHSYGITSENIVWWGEQYNYNGDKLRPKLIVGKFCSIGRFSKFFLGGNHRHDWISTYPFHIQWVHSNTFDALPREIPGYGHTNGNITIGNDVWFGENVTVMSGVQIGDGAVIAANSTVAANVDAYSITGGNPAKHIKYRFDHAVIEKLLKIQWWNMEEDKLNKLIPYLVKNDLEMFFAKYYEIARS